MLKVKKYIKFTFISLFVLIIFSIQINAQTLTYNEVKNKGILLENELQSHLVYIIVGNLSSDYLSCDIYIFGKYFIDFSKTEYATLIYKSEISRIYLQFATYKNFFNQNEEFPYCETFKILIKIDDIFKILERKNEKMYLQIVGIYSSITAKLANRFINILSKLDIEEEDEYKSLNINIRPYTFFMIIYPANIYYTFYNNTVIDGIACSCLFNHNITLEAGFYFKIPILSAISLYYSSIDLYDYQSNFEVTKILGVKVYLTIFDLPESVFLRLAFFSGLGNMSINNYNTYGVYFNYSFSLVLGFPVATSLEYICSLSIGKVESQNTALLLQFAFIFNLF